MDPIDWPVAPIVWWGRDPRKSAQGEQCLVRLPGICNGNPETVVLAHLPDGSGTGKMGGKSADIHATYACSACHDAIDGRIQQHKRGFILLAAYEGQQRTLRRFIEKGLIQI